MPSRGALEVSVALVALASALCATLMSAGCDSAEVMSCGRGGELATVNGYRYCVYRAEAIAADMVTCAAGSRRIDVEGAVLCTDLPRGSELTPSTCETLDVSCEEPTPDSGPPDMGPLDGDPPADTGSMDAAQMDGGEDCEAEPLAPCTGGDAACRITLVAAGLDVTCAITMGGDLFCWGNNGSGELGDESKCPRRMIVRPHVEGPVVQVAVGNRHVCVRTGAMGATVQCWGSNGYGQLARPLAETGSVEPVTIEGIPPAEEIDVGGDHSCAITRPVGSAEPELWCWGRNDFGQTAGVGSGVAPTRVVLPDLGDVGLGSEHSCALSTDHTTLRCWGRSAHGELGDGMVRTSPEFTRTPVETMLDPISDVTAGSDHTCIRRNAAGETFGRIECFGSMVLAESGTGQAPSATPVLVPTPVDVMDMGMPVLGGSMSSHGHTTCALFGPDLTRMRIFCWGDNAASQILLPEGRHDAVVSTPVQITSPDLTSSVLSVAVGARHVCALTGRGLFCWGSNSASQAVPSSASPSISTPTMVPIPIGP